MKELIEQLEKLLAEINQPLARRILLDIARRRLKELIEQLKNTQE